MKSEKDRTKEKAQNEEEDKKWKENENKGKTPEVNSFNASTDEEVRS